MSTVSVMLSADSISSLSLARYIERAERERIVQEALLELPDAAREVIVLHDYEGIAHDRIAEMLGASHAAIRKRYSRALKALGEILQGRLEA